MEQFDLILLARTSLAAALGFLIGYLRERRGSPAGDRTYAMIALGAAAFTTIGVDDFPATAEKLIAGVVTGVGFLGAGVIMRQGTGEVRGLTTAASIWAVAAVGVVVGAGDYLMGAIIAVMIAVILEWNHLPILARFGHAPSSPSRDEAPSDG
jgi:putative Mg2+ transporter-C (MgtC) family protein